MKNKFYILTVLLFLLAVNSCQTDDSIAAQPFVAGFEEESHDLSLIPDEKVIKVVFSDKTESAGSVVIRVSAVDAVYGVDFTTIPAAENGTFVLPFEAGVKEKSFIFKNLIFPFKVEDETKKIRFDVIEINYVLASNIQGYTASTISFERSLGGTLMPETGGPNQGNQVYIDLSKKMATTVRRDSWDL